jgi:Tfp pilus assembly protein PilZ
VSLRVDFPGDEGSRADEATSLSTGGMFVRTERELPVGALLPVALELPDGDPPAPVQGRILYKSKRRPRGVEPGFGVQFVAGDETFRARVGRYIDSLLRNSNVPTARLLSIARDLLREKGWSQLYPRGVDGSYCLTVALREAARDDRDLYRAALRSLGSRLDVEACAHGGFDCHCAVVRWNDREGRTQRQVIAKLDEVISAELSVHR